MQFSGARALDHIFEPGKILRDAAPDHPPEERSADFEEPGGVASRMDSRDRAAGGVLELVSDLHRKRLVDFHLDKTITVGSDHAIFVAECTSHEANLALDPRSRAKSAWSQWIHFDHAARPRRIVLWIEHDRRDGTSRTLDRRLDSNID